MLGDASHLVQLIYFPNSWGILSSVWQSVWGYVYTKPDSFYASTKTIPDSASVHTYERWFRRDFCNGGKLHRADLLKWRVTYRIGVHTIPENFLSAQKAICLVWSKPKFLSLFVGPFPADRPRISNSAKKLKIFQLRTKKYLVNPEQSSEHVCTIKRGVLKVKWVLTWVNIKLKTSCTRHLKSPTVQQQIKWVSFC